MFINFYTKLNSFISSSINSVANTLGHFWSTMNHCSGFLCQKIQKIQSLVANIFRSTETDLETRSSTLRTERVSVDTRTSHLSESQVLETKDENSLVVALFEEEKKEFVRKVEEGLDRESIQKTYLEIAKAWNTHFQSLNTTPENSQTCKDMLKLRKEIDLTFYAYLKRPGDPLPKEIEDASHALANLLMSLFDQQLEKPEGKDWYQIHYVMAKELHSTTENVLKFSSIFMHFPLVNKAIQEYRESLENQARNLDKNLCDKYCRDFMPNPSIPDDGNCLFSSFQMLYNAGTSIKEYRKQAVNYLREHIEEYRIGIIDASSDGQAKNRLALYAIERGGEENWKAELKRKLDRDPEPEDFYLDCMENSILWGGFNELAALSKIYKTPVYIFTSDRKDAPWRLDAKLGEEYIISNPPLFLYFSGQNHYQNLIPKLA